MTLGNTHAGRVFHCTYELFQCFFLPASALNFVHSLVDGMDHSQYAWRIVSMSIYSNFQFGGGSEALEHAVTVNTIGLIQCDKLYVPLGARRLKLMGSQINEK